MKSGMKQNEIPQEKYGHATKKKNTLIAHEDKEEQRGNSSAEDDTEQEIWHARPAA